MCDLKGENTSWRVLLLWLYIHEREAPWLYFVSSVTPWGKEKFFKKHRCGGWFIGKLWSKIFVKILNYPPSSQPSREKSRNKCRSFALREQKDTSSFRTIYCTLRGSVYDKRIEAISSWCQPGEWTQAESTAHGRLLQGQVVWSVYVCVCVCVCACVCVRVRVGGFLVCVRFSLQIGVYAAYTHIHTPHTECLHADRC